MENRYINQVQTNDLSFEMEQDEYQVEFVYRFHLKGKREDAEGPSHLPDRGWPEKNGGFP